MSVILVTNADDAVKASGPDDICITTAAFMRELDRNDELKAAAASGRWEAVEAAITKLAALGLVDNLAPGSDHRVWIWVADDKPAPRPGCVCIALDELNRFLELPEAGLLKRSFEDGTDPKCLDDMVMALVASGTLHDIWAGASEDVIQEDVGEEAGDRG